MSEHPRGRWTAARLLRATLAAQCLLAGLVVLADVPGAALTDWSGGGPSAPPGAVPIAPGDQTRQFQPDRLPATLPGRPNGLPDLTVPRRLDFTAAEIEGYSDAVRLTGTIAEGDAARFAEWLAARSAPPDAVALHSPGGSVTDALQIGRSLRALNLPVLVTPGESCLSACPYILAAGQPRRVSRSAYVGVHQHYFGENTFLPAFLLVSDIQAGQGEVMTYLNDMGIDPMLMTKALQTPPDDIFILLPEELEGFRLATELLD